MQCTTYVSVFVFGPSMSSMRIGGGSTTLRSLSPNPHARADSGCCRTMRVYLLGGKSDLAAL